jgi:hypothetical protein
MKKESGPVHSIHRNIELVRSISHLQKIVPFFLSYDVKMFQNISRMFSYPYFHAMTS